MYRSILVPLDGSPFSEHALPLALALARRAGAALQLVHVHSTLAAYYLDGAGYLEDSLDTHVLRQQQIYLETLAHRLGAMTSVPVSNVILQGGIVSTLAEHAANRSADLVVMTTHGRGTFGRFWLGSVADELVRRLPMPVLLTQPHEAAPDFTQNVLPRFLLLPLDGSSLAELMVEPVLELARLTGAEVTLLRVVKSVMAAAYPVEAYTVDEAARAVIDRIEEMQEQVKKEASEYLENIARRFREKAVKVQMRVAVEHQPALAILREAASRDGGLIAIETHGRKGLARMLLGSVADKVIRGTPVPVLVHRPLNAGKE